MKEIHIQHYKTNGVAFILGSFEGKLCLLDFAYRKARATLDKRLKKLLNAEFVEKEDELIILAKKELDEYFKGQRREFSVPLLMLGTAFQKSVWSALLKIPYGETQSYKELSKSIENEKAVRAVANTNGANAIAIMIPCHRVIASDGGLGGYAGGVELKKQLLQIESISFLKQNYFNSKELKY